jgi:integrase/recombinase XerD
MSLKLTRRDRSNHWYIRGSVRGQSVFETTGTHDKEAADAIRIGREARLLNDSVYGPQASVTFAEAAVSYLAAGGSPRFLGDGKWTGLIGRFYNRPLHSITQNELDEAATELYPGTSAETRNRQAYTPFVAVWNHAVGNRWAEFRKWSRPKKLKGTVVKLPAVRAGTRPVAYEHASQFVLAMSPAPAMVMTALFYTGMRPIELFALEASQVNISGRWVVLPSSKTGEPRGVPLHEFLVPMFTELVRRGGHLFRSPRGEPYPVREGISGQMKTAIKGARIYTGIGDVSPYTARHTVSTQLVINGVHPHIKDQILGHAVTDMSRHYTHVPQLPLIEAINTLPTVPKWTDAPWIMDPLAHAHKIVSPRRLTKDAGVTASALDETHPSVIRAKSVQ